MSTANGGSAPKPQDADPHPVWSDDGTTDVQALFKSPYFVPDASRTAVGQAWHDNMLPLGLDLFDIQSVFGQGTAIYYKLLPPNGNMPLPVTGYDQKFPPEACEKFRLWYNDGGRAKTTDPIPGPNQPKNPIPPPGGATRPVKVPANPVWDAQSSGDDDIQMCFTNPCWIQGGQSIASGWREAMMNFQYDASIDPNVYLDLQNFEHVKGSARKIYSAVASQFMPLGDAKFSDEANEIVRLWYNQGCRHMASDPIVPAQDPLQPISADPNQRTFVPPPYRIRKDINTLTEEELTAYRMQITKLKPYQVDGSLWQTGGLIHANWCLHYMEASFPWHRAHLLWLENQLDGPIPSWNFFSTKAADPTSPDSGLPQAFLDDTFKAPDGSVLQNPLRHAWARGGKSRASTGATPYQEVTRAPAFQQPGSVERAQYIQKYVPSYLAQLYMATQMQELGTPQGEGIPFAWGTGGDVKQLNDLTPSNPDVFYKNVQQEFDGVLEQAHDNLHGWAGPDMANNSFAAYDPIFWSFHANFDRIFEAWVRLHPNTKWSANVVLRPFIGHNGDLSYQEVIKDQSQYTTIGDMVQDSKTLGYAYAPPGNPDYVPAAKNVSLEPSPIILFPNVKCTQNTYIVYVALDPHRDGKPLVVGAPGYVGSITRLGMGPDDGNDRCIQGYVARRLEACKAANDLGGLPTGTDVPLKLLVLEDTGKGDRREFPESEYQNWTGFRPLLVWGEPVAGVIAQQLW